MQRISHILFLCLFWPNRHRIFPDSQLTVTGPCGYRTLVVADVFVSEPNHTPLVSACICVRLHLNQPLCPPFIIDQILGFPLHWEDVSPSLQWWANHKSNIGAWSHMFGQTDVNLFARAQIHRRSYDSLKTIFRLTTVLWQLANSQNIYDNLKTCLKIESYDHLPVKLKTRKRNIRNVSNQLSLLVLSVSGDTVVTSSCWLIQVNYDLKL